MHQFPPAVRHYRVIGGNAMKITDVELINRILNGDDTAFTELVKKYQKPVHALVWRKIGDFHIAEEITQDTFLKAYQGLATLKKPQRFASWLYVIATNNSNTWLRKKRLWTQSLEDIRNSQFGKATYSQYVVEEKERTAVEAQREVVKKLLAKLPESERTIITLHYFSEMSSAEIGAFLGVSANTIRSRLRRAQQRLQKEETMIREALEHFKLSPNLTDNIMQEVARLKPAAPSGSKPLVPWAIAASSAILIMLMLGIGSQNLVRFQQSYSLDAQAETTVELVDTPIVLNLDTEPDVRNQLGNTNALGISDNNGQKQDGVLFAAAETEEDDKTSAPKQQWIQSEPVKGSFVSAITGTSGGEIFTYVHGLIYKFSSDKKEWEYVPTANSLVTNYSGSSHIKIKEWNSTFYLFLTEKLFTSKDEGMTWDLLYTFPIDRNLSLFDFIASKQALYVIFSDNTVFRSEDNGKTWNIVNNELPKALNTLVVVQDIMFAGTHIGLYRKNIEGWEHLKFPISRNIEVTSILSIKDKLYVTGLPYPYSENGQNRWIFRSTDLGESWDDITPTITWSKNRWPPGIKLIGTDETLLVMEQGMVRSEDSGDTWLSPPLTGTTPTMQRFSSSVVTDEGIIYVGSPEDGLFRSTDSGRSWKAVSVNPVVPPIHNLIAYKSSGKTQNTPSDLYGIYLGEIANTTDKGKSWQVVRMSKAMTDNPDIMRVPPSISQIVKYREILYARGTDTVMKDTLIYCISSDDRTLEPIQEMPVLNAKSNLRRDLFQEALEGVFAVDNDTFYIEYNYKLFRWKQGDTEWSDTGLEETLHLSKDILRRTLKLAVSGDTVYVGKRDGHLLVSYDRGDNWVDLTPALPFRVKTFNDIVVTEATVYVATDVGIITSDGGRTWGTATNTTGTNLIMEHLAVEGTTLYGINNTGIYRLESNVWEQVVSDVPDNITSLAVDENTLYVGTQDRGMLHYNLEE